MTSQEYLESICPCPLTLIWNQNLRSYLSFRKERSKITLRVHRLFEKADHSILDALMSYVCHNNKEAKSLMRRYVHEYFANTTLPRIPLLTRGKVYDLQVFYDRIKKQFFSPSFDAVIGWSRAPKRKKYRHITFGTYDRHRRRILIHPLLDQIGVPEYFIEFVVYHEMLHAEVPAQIDTAGRCRSHTKQFRLREQLFPFYLEAKKWEKQSLMFFKGKANGRS